LDWHEGPRRVLESLRRVIQSNPRVMAVAGPAAALLVLVLGFVLIYQLAYANRVYPGVRALGQDLGGYSREEAQRVLQRSLEELARRQITVFYRDQSWTMTAQELGLRTDLTPVLESVFSVGREGSVFGRFWAQLGLWGRGRTYDQPATAFDPAAQSAALDRFAREIDRPVVEAELTVKPDFSVELQPGQNGRKLDTAASRERLQEALSLQGTTRVELIVHEIPPQKSDSNLSAARDQASRILAAPITLTHGGKVWTLDRPHLASILRFNNQAGTSQAAYLDRAPLEVWAKSLADAVDQTPQNARFSWSGGAMEVLQPSREGLELDVTATVDAIIAEANGDHRDIALPVKVTPADVAAEERHELGIKGLLESARTSYSGSVPAKQENIALAAKRLNGVVVPPGGMFSFNKELGPTTLDAGFKMGFGISNAGGSVKTVPSVAGGICQVATTLFHAVFWSGYQIEERNWHLYWIPSYTSKGVVGLDATVDEEANLDFKFINPTQNHLLIQSWVDGAANIHFALYGTPAGWTVKVDPSVKTDVVAADTSTTYTEEEASMPEGQRVAVERAVEGFAVTNVRHVIQGSDDRVLRLTSRYRPSRNVILVGTGGKPPGRGSVVETNKPAASDARPTAAPTTVRTPAPTTAAAPTATVAPTKPAAAPTRTPAPTRAPSSNDSGPTPTPKPR
jgi:vancomycin resistance protein YoaR